MSHREHTHDHAQSNDDIVAASSGQTEPRHPLDPLTGDEIDAARAILVSSRLLGETVRVPMLLPYEPEKDELVAWTSGDEMDRRVEATLMDAATGAVVEVVVSITRGIVLEQRDHDPSQAPYGQPQYLFEEYERAARIVKASPGWQAAMARRGLADRIELAFCGPLAPGFVGPLNGSGSQSPRPRAGQGGTAPRARSGWLTGPAARTGARTS